MSQEEEKTTVRSIRFPKELILEIDTYVKRIGKSTNKYLQDLAIVDLAKVRKKVK